MLKNKYLYLLLGLFIVLGIFLRFFKLSEYPVHLGHDEVTQLYDSISILRTGKDIHGNKLPFIFKSVGDYKPPFYTYSTIIPLLIFGWQDITIRIVCAFFGVLTIPAVYYFTYTLFNNKKIALIGCFFTTITPFEIFYSRKSFENGAGVFFVLIGFGLLLKYLKYKNKIGLYYLGNIALICGMYTYFSHAIIIPILYTFYVLIFRNDLKKVPIKVIVVSLLALAPLLYFIIADSNSSNRSKSVFIIQDIELHKIINNNITQEDRLGILKRGFIITKYSFIRYVDQLNPYYLFGNGLDLTNQDPIDSGPLYFYELPFLLLGLCILFKKKNSRKIKYFILLWIIIGLIPSGITFEKHSPHRILMVFTMLNIISAYGFYYFFKIVFNYKSYFAVKILITLTVGLIMIWSFNYFAYLFLVDYSYDQSDHLHYPYKNVVLYAWSQHDNYKQIIFDPKFGKDAPFIGTGAQYYLGYYGHYLPEKMQSEFKLGDEKKRETLFDKFSIRAVFWLDDAKIKDTLFLASPWSLPADIESQANIIKTFYFYGGEVAYYALTPKL